LSRVGEKTPVSGYEVVLRHVTDVFPAIMHTGYRGVFRQIQWPAPLEEEAAGVEASIFGDYSDPKTGFIPSLEKAKQLLEIFSASPRPFEIIHCEVVDAGSGDRDATHDALCLGFDVANPGDRWSIVADYPFEPESHEPRMKEYWEALNQNGLFNSSREARAYLNRSRELEMEDLDAPFEVYDIHAVDLG